MSARDSALPSWLAERADGCVLSIHVQPGARGAGVVGEHGDALKIRIDSPPIEGRANQALIAFLASRLGLAKGAVTLLAGESSRRKRVLVTGLPAADLLQRLNAGA